MRDVQPPVGGRVFKVRMAMTGYDCQAAMYVRVQVVINRGGDSGPEESVYNDIVVMQ